MKKYHKKTSIVLVVILLLGLTLVIKRIITSRQETENNFSIFYAISNNNNAYWIVKDGNKIFDINPSNNYIKNFNGDIKKYLDFDKNEYNYKQYKSEFNAVKESFKSISISEKPYETNYIQNHKMRYDLNIDSTGKATANVYYPNEKKGGYKFTLSKNEFCMLKGIVNKSSYAGQKYFIDNNYCSQAIVINDQYILNDYDKMKTNLDIQAIIMFSNLFTLKYITEQNATDNTYKIESSKYTKMYKPEPLHNR